MKNVTPKAGQVWRDNISGYEWTITDISNGVVQLKMLARDLLRFGSMPLSGFLEAMEFIS